MIRYAVIASPFSGIAAACRRCGNGSLRHRQRRLVENDDRRPRSRWVYRASRAASHDHPAPTWVAHSNRPKGDLGPLGRSMWRSPSADVAPSSANCSKMPLTAVPLAATCANSKSKSDCQASPVLRRPESFGERVILALRVRTRSVAVSPTRHTAMARTRAAARRVAQRAVPAHRADSVPGRRCADRPAQ